MQEQRFSPEDSIRLIQSMIDKTRRGLSDQSHYFLLWGWSALAGCIGQFLLKAVAHYQHHYIVWLISVPCIILTIYFSIRDGKKSGVKTYIGENMKFLWTGIGASFFVLSMIFIRLGWYNCYPFFIMLYGLGAFVSGRILQFKPLVAGGFISWALAAAAIWFSFDYQTLFAAAAILSSYIIPGHLIRNQHSQQKLSLYGK